MSSLTLLVNTAPVAGKSINIINDLLEQQVKLKGAISIFPSASIVLVYVYMK